MSTLSMRTTSQQDQQVNPLSMRASTYIWIFVLFCAVTASTAPYIFAQRGPHYQRISLVFPVVLLLVAGGLLFFPRPGWLRKILKSPFVWIGCFLLLGCFDELRYVQRILPHPETCSASPALMRPALRLFHLQDPYALRLPDGAPVSPGPDWIMLLAPITLPRLAGLLTAITGLIFAGLLSREDPEGASVFAVLTVMQPVVVNSSAWGTDLFAIPIVFSILCLLVGRWSEHRRALVFLGIFAGVFAQSRVPMAALAFILSFGLWRRNPQNAKSFMIPLVTVLVVSYAVFLLWAKHDHVFFQPMHLLRRERGSGVASSVIGPILGSATLLWVIFRMKGEPRDWLLAGGLLLVGTFAPTGFGELSTRVQELRLWEGANYVSFGGSVLAAYLAWRRVDAGSDMVRRRAAH